MIPRNRVLPYNPKLRQRARELRKNGTLGEALLWREIRCKALGVEFHRQVPIGEYIVDFFCHERMLAIEVDGGSHNHEESFEYDTSRQGDLEALGVRFLRFSESDIRRNRVEIAEAVKVWIEQNP